MVCGSGGRTNAAGQYGQFSKFNLEKWAQALGALNPSKNIMRSSWATALGFELLVLNCYDHVLMSRHVTSRHVAARHGTARHGTAQSWLVELPTPGRSLAGLPRGGLRASTESRIFLMSAAVGFSLPGAGSLCENQTLPWKRQSIVSTPYWRNLITILNFEEREREEKERSDMCRMLKQASRPGSGVYARGRADCRVPGPPPGPARAAIM